MADKFTLPPTKKGASAPDSGPELEVPRWELTEDTFIAPHLVRRGSVISSRNYPPGFHTKPLNEAASRLLTAWYEETKVVAAHLDENGNLVPEKTYYPHRQYQPFAAGERPDAVDFVLEEGPPDDLPGDMDLATANLQHLDPANPATFNTAPGPLVPRGKQRTAWYGDMDTAKLGGTAATPPPSGASADDGTVIETSAPTPPPKERVVPQGSL